MSHINKKEAAGFLIAGAALGAGIALLYAPQSGARTQKDIRRFARKTVNRLDDLQLDIRDQVTDWVDNVTEALKDGVDRGKKIGAEGYAQVLQSFDAAKKSVDDGKNRLEHLMKGETA
jgi:gas vesicle protein